MYLAKLFAFAFLAIFIAFFIGLFFGSLMTVVQISTGGSGSRSYSQPHGGIACSGANNAAGRSADAGTATNPLAGIRAPAEDQAQA